METKLNWKLVDIIRNKHKHPELYYWTQIRLRILATLCLVERNHETAHAKKTNDHSVSMLTSWFNLFLALSWLLFDATNLTLF